MGGEEAAAPLDLHSQLSEVMQRLVSQTVSEVALLVQGAVARLRGDLARKEQENEVLHLRLALLEDNVRAALERAVAAERRARALGCRCGEARGAAAAPSGSVPGDQRVTAGPAPEEEEEALFGPECLTRAPETGGEQEGLGAPPAGRGREDAASGPPDCSPSLEIKVEPRVEVDPAGSAASPAWTRTAESGSDPPPEGGGEGSLLPPAGRCQGLHVGSDQEGGLLVSAAEWEGPAESGAPPALPGPRQRGCREEAGLCADAAAAPGPYTCGECGKSFGAARGFKTHLLLHRDQRFPCPQCGRRFSMAGNLKIHLRLHTGERPHRCADCGLAFTFAEQLRRHRLAHTGAKPYHCAVCPKAFRRKDQLNAHERVHASPEMSRVRPR